MIAKERDIKKAYKEYAAQLRSDLAANGDRARDFAPGVKVVGHGLLKLHTYEAFRNGYLAGFKDKAASK